MNAQGSNNLSLPLTLNDNGVFQVSSGSLTVAGTIDNGGHGVTVSTAGSATATLDGAISGAGGLVKSGTGTLVVTAQNTYGGSTTVIAGTLQATLANAIPSSTTLIVGSGGALVFDPGLEESQTVSTASPVAAATSFVVAEGGATALSSSGNMPVVVPTATAAAIVHRDSVAGTSVSGSLGKGSLAVSASTHLCISFAPSDVRLPSSPRSGTMYSSSVADLHAAPAIRASLIGTDSTSHAATKPVVKTLGAGAVGEVLSAPASTDCQSGQKAVLTAAMVDLVLSQRNW